MFLLLWDSSNMYCTFQICWLGVVASITEVKKMPTIDWIQGKHLLKLPLLYVMPI